MSRPINQIVIHCSATPDGRWTTAADIDGWHQQRGFKRGTAARLALNPDLHAIGYHHVIYTSGAIATGRAHDEIGAHAQGFNQRSLGICLIGTARYRAEQWAALAELIKRLTQPQGGRPARYPDCRIAGHRDLPGVNKSCPGFDVAAWISAGMAPLADHLLKE